jgi:hypothetical protein
MNGVLALSDLFLAGALAKGVAKGAIKTAAPHVWRPPPSMGEGARAWLGRKGYLKPGQHGHHWAIPQNGWGRNVPDAIKNQPWNIKPMPSAEVHGRITGSYKGKSQFNAPQRYWYGTPAWSKVGTGSAVGHPAVDAEESRKRKR